MLRGESSIKGVSSTLVGLRWGGKNEFQERDMGPMVTRESLRDGLDWMDSAMVWQRVQLALESTTITTCRTIPTPKLSSLYLLL
jgi:hypothetical protein